MANNFDREVQLCRSIQEHYEAQQNLIRERDELNRRIADFENRINYMTSNLLSMLELRAADSKTPEDAPVVEE